MLHGSHVKYAEMSIISRSYQLGEGQGEYTGMSVVVHPSRLFYGSQKLTAETLCEKRSHQLGEGQQSFAEMPDIKHPSRPVHRGHQNNAAMSFLSRLAREGSTKACNQQCQSFTTLPDQFYLGQASRAAMPTPKYPREGSVEPRRNAIYDAPFPTSLWANPCTQKCHGVDAHQLGKDIICTLIKPLLFLPFLLIYGSQKINAETLCEKRSHQIWATSTTQQC